jgi:hypothetical protein|tara:strand:- start:2360 stop:3682 length:1323 start_codon:yes stop_codon:yes gene_type:complete
MASTYINRTLATNNQKKLTISVWVKIAKVQEQMIVSSYYSGAYWGALYFGGDGTLRFYDYRNSYILKLLSNALYRDTSAWYHIVANFDCSIGSPTAKLYVNGEEVSYNTQTIYSQNATTSWNTDYDFQIGKGSDLGGNQFNGVMSDLYFIQGYTYDASTFGETDTTTGEWKPKTDPTINYGGTGGNSCHLKFANSANMDLDSGSNNLTLSTTGNLTQTEDCPSNVFATMNPLNFQADGYTIQNGNNSIIGNASNTWRSLYGTLGASTGKFYWEQKINNNTDSSHIIGISDIDKMKNSNDNDFENTGTSAYGYRPDGAKISKNALSAGYGNTYTTNDIIGVAVDLDNSKIYFSKNGVFQNSGVPTSGSTGTGAAYTIDANTTYTATTSTNAGNNYYSYNFGNGFFGTTAISSEGTNASGIGKFEYDVPAGYTALSTKGLNL